MPSGVTEKNPTMEPAATTPFRVTVSVSPHLNDCYGSFMVITRYCQVREGLAHPERRVYVKLADYLLLSKCGGGVKYCQPQATVTYFLVKQQDLNINLEQFG